MSQQLESKNPLISISLSVFSTVFFLLTVLLALGMSGCSKSTGSGEGDGTGLSDEDLALQNKNRFGDGTIPYAQGEGALQDVLFDYDSSEILPEYMEVLKQNAAKLAAEPSLRAEVEGHCDKRGTSEYNLALGERRAKAVAAMLVNYGVGADQLSTISYGEEIPLENGEGDGAFAKNRRAHFALYSKNN